ncbi:flagellar basal body L-ring protein FlgH [Azospirillum doebereinerae]|uniref:Flagellar L-ring protein n=1 Tax=Azospirillum doebereinerae TaxID=92933 RepID=A0A433J291_9PROT|nr:flagellar basal body L-ring protein FlgH [Azospirillum doebereinerae]RUQ65214.1 flagellar basal body L-ring protein FlgH [Azospirillum doebereinerae]
MTALHAAGQTALRFAPRLLLIAAAAVSLTACNAASRIGDIGKAPELSGIQDPHAQPGYQPVSLPMPTPLPTERNPNSLWRTGAKAFFKDQRANKVGDILTVNISIDDQAKLANESKRSRANGEKAGMPNLFGLEVGTLSRVLPAGANASSLVDLSSSTNNDGKGSVDRNEKIVLKVAALVSQSLPNGNLVIQGRQEVRVNYEARDLQITGVIRPEDITAQNTISYEKIAEARISYGGRGQITDVQQPRYGQQLYDIIMPF